MIAARAVVDLRRAADLAHPHDERVLQLPGAFEIEQQPRPRGIEHLHVRFVADKIIRVAVVIILTDLDERHARRDQFAREKTAAPKITRAIQRLVRGPILRRVEERFRAQQPPRAFLRNAMAFVNIRRVGLLRLGFHREEQFVASFLARGGKVRAGEVRKLAVAIDAERLVARPEITRAGVARRPHAHEARQIRVRLAEIFRDHRAQLRMRRALGLLVARVHVVDAVGMIRRLRAQAANDAELVHELRHARQIFANVVAGKLRLDLAKRSARGPPRLHVERVDLAGTAIHPQKNAAFAALGRLGGDALRIEKPAPVRHGDASRGGERALEQRAAGKMFGSATISVHARIPAGLKIKRSRSWPTKHTKHTKWEKQSGRTKRSSFPRNWSPCSASLSFRVFRVFRGLIRLFELECAPWAIARHQ